MSTKIKCSYRFTFPWHRIQARRRDAGAADEGEEGVEEAQVGLNLQDGINHTQPTQQDSSLKPKHKWHPHNIASWASSGMPAQIRAGHPPAHSLAQHQEKPTRTGPFSTFVWPLSNTRQEDLLD